jgi:hypothetical protein
MSVDPDIDLCMLKSPMEAPQTTMRNIDVPTVRLTCTAARRFAHFTEAMYEIRMTSLSAKFDSVVGTN